MRIPLPNLFRRRRARTRALLQIEFVECGAAALGIVLDYHGRKESLSRLREMCKVSRDGSGADAILSAAREFGLDARAFSCEVEHLRRLPAPYIVFWNFNHFVVVEGFSSKRVFLNDPTSGRISLSLDEFDRAFTGVALAFEKTAEFRKGGSRVTAVRSLMRRLEGQRLGLLFVALSSLALIVPSIISAALPKIFFDSILAQGAAHWIRPLTAAMSLTAVLLCALTLLQQRALARVENNLAVRSASEFFWRLLRLPMGFFSHRHAGELVGTVTANDRVAGLLAGDVATNLVSALLAGAYLALMIRYDRTLTAVVIAVAILNAAALRFVAKRRSQDSQRIAKERSRLCGSAIAGVSSIETLKAMGSEGEFFNAWAGQHADLMSAEQDMQRSHIFLSTMSPLLSATGAAVVLGLGGLRIMDGWLSLGMLVAFQTLMWSFLDPLNRLLNLGSKLQQIQGDLCRLDDVLGNPVDSEFDGHATAASPAVLSGEIEFRDVTFGYSAGEPLLRNFNLCVPAGSRVALVGASGSGKSTVVKLLAGLYRPWSGEIRFDGRKRDDLPRDLIKNSISMVDQDVTLIAGSFADNIALMDETLPPETLIGAARDAAMHDEIMAKPGGYRFQLAEMGGNLSFGQRQRVDIARALAANPRILILDEATSALDPLTEQVVLDNLRRRGCTCVVAAHRLSAIRDCDEIVVLENGSVVERGGHEELRRRNGKYAALMAEG